MEWINHNRVYNTKQTTTIGVVAERWHFDENRVAMTPNAVREATMNGHIVFVQNGAGSRAGFSDESYKMSGATMVSSTEEVYQRSEIMVKVAKPSPQEYDQIKPQQVIFCFMDSDPTMTQFMDIVAQRQANVFFYENMKKENNSAPVINAVSEVSGYLAVQQGMKFLERQDTGCGMLLGKVAGEHGANVLVIGSGVAAMRAATLASSMGAKVTVMDSSTEKLRWVSETTGVETLIYSTENLERMLPLTQLLIGAVIPNANKQMDATTTLANTVQMSQMRMCPVVSNYQMNMMRKGSAAIDLGMKFGGNFESSEETSVERPVLLWNNKVLINAMSSITTYTPHSTSKVISNAVLPYVLLAARNGWKNAVNECPEMRQALFTGESRQWSNVLPMSTNYPSQNMFNRQYLSEVPSDMSKLTVIPCTQHSYHKEMTFKNQMSYPKNQVNRAKFGMVTPFTIEA